MASASCAQARSRGCRGGGVAGVPAPISLFQIRQGRGEMFLRIHDEHSYKIQAEMLARGRLWSAAYPPDISPFFDTFHFIVDRVYASIYFPGGGD